MRCACQVVIGSVVSERLGLEPTAVGIESPAQALLLLSEDCPNFVSGALSDESWSPGLLVPTSLASVHAFDVHKTVIEVDSRVRLDGKHAKGWIYEP